MSPISWPLLPAAQQPQWPDGDKLKKAQEILQTLPPLVFAGECDELTAKLAEVEFGKLLF